MAEKINFEKSVARLDEIVKLLERGDVPLEKALVLFEEGTGLIKQCGSLLDKAEQKVILLTKDTKGELKTLPFAIEDKDGTSTKT